MPSLLTPLEQSFNGFHQDHSRDQIPKGVLWRMADFIPDLGAPVRKRGGWTYLGSKPSGAKNYVTGAGYFRKTTGVVEQLIWTDERGNIFKDALDGSVSTRVGATASIIPPTHPPVYFLGKLVIPDGNYDAQYWSGTSVSGAVASGYKVYAAWGDFFIFANTKADSTILKWATSVTEVITGSFWNLPGEIVAIAGLPRQLLVFGYSDTWTLLGDNPPPGGNMQQRTLYAGNGCMDARCVLNTGALVVWANTTGVYITSGSEPIPRSLTKRAGIDLFWQTKVSGFNANAGWCAAASQYRNFYVISVTEANRNPVVTLMFDLDSNRVIEITNVSSRAFARQPGASGHNEELYWGRAQEPRIARTSPLWTPGSPTSAYDGDGSAVLPYLETAFYRLAGFGQERIRNVQISYDLSSTIGNSQLDVGFAISPESTTYETATRALPLTNGQDRKIADIRRKARGVGLRIALHAAADDLSIFGIETEGHTQFEKR